MNRALPIRLNQMPIAARAHLQPTGAHTLEMDLGVCGDLKLSIADARRVRSAIEAFETEVMRDDGHTNRVNPAIRMLGEF